MCSLCFLQLVIVFNLSIATSLSENLFLADDTAQSEMWSLGDANLNSDLSDSSDFISGSSLDGGNTNLFRIPSEDDLGLGNSLASAQSQNSCQAGNGLTSDLQGRDTDTSICGTSQMGIQLNLPLDLFNDGVEFLRGNLPPPKQQGSQRQSPEEELFGQLFDNLHPKDVLDYLKKCTDPFIFPLCCDGSSRDNLAGTIIAEISNCDAGVVHCFKKIEACCMEFVSGLLFLSLIGR